MTKGAKKPNPKSEAKVADVEKKPKIAKKTKAPDAGAKKAVAGGAKPARVKKGNVTRNYFNVAEDNQILEQWKASTGTAISTLAKNLAASMGRTVESIRDRLKRYITKLTPNDQKEIANQAKKNPKHYIHFKANADKTKKIEKVSAVTPALQNREFDRRPRVSKKKPVAKSGKKPPTPDEKFKWVSEKLQNKDAYFKLEFGVQFLADVLNVLISSEGVSVNEVNAYLANTHCDQTLNQVLDHFKIKDK